MGRIILECEKLKNVYSGLGQFCLHLGHALVQQQQEDLCFYVPKDKKGIFGNKAEYILQSGLHKFTRVKTQGNDVFHALHQDSKYFPSQRGTDYVLTVHDLNFLYKYEGYKLRKKKRILQQKIDRASAITAISHFAAGELRDHMDLKGKDVTVIHNGNSLNTNISPEKPKGIGENPFVFSIGVMLPRKNFHVLIPFIEKLKDHQLVIAGKMNTPYAQELAEKVKRAGLDERVFFPGNVSDAEKLWLYQNCEAFVFPSLAEGFGLPVVEAMSQGKPVFLNNATSLPEIGGKDAFYWNDFDAQYMAEVFEKGMLYFNQHQLRERYMQHAQQFTWEHAASQYARVYASLRH